MNPKLQETSIIDFSHIEQLGMEVELVFISETKGKIPVLSQ